MSTQHSAPCSPTDTPSVPLDINQRKALLRSADNSPVHRLLPEMRKTAPLPPPRRSSMSTCTTPSATPPLTPCGMKEEITSNGHPMQFSTFKRNTLSAPAESQNNYTNVYISQQSNSETNLLKIFEKDNKLSTDKIKTQLSRLSYLHNNTDGDTEPETVVDTEAKPSEEEHPMSYIDELHAKAFPNGSRTIAQVPVMGTKVDKHMSDTNAPLSTIKQRPYHSPALVRREISRSTSQSSSGDDERTETTGVEDATRFINSNKSIIARSTSFGGSVTHSPSGSPRPTSTSTLINRHSSLSRMAERAASPLRALFGGNSSSSRSRNSDASPTRTPQILKRSAPRSLHNSTLPRVRYFISLYQYIICHIIT